MSEQTSNQASTGSARRTRRHITKVDEDMVIGRRVAEAEITAYFLADMAKVMRESAQAGAPDGELSKDGWTIAYRRQPSPRVQIRAVSPRLYELICKTLGALGYEVRIKGDHVVAVLPKQ